MSILSPATKRTYESCLRTTMWDKKANAMRFAPTDLHEQVDVVIKYLEEAHPSPNSRRTYLSAIMWKVKSEDEDVWKKYKVYFDKLKVKADEQTSSQSVSPQKQENYVEWGIINDAMFKAYDDYKNWENKDETEGKHQLTPENYLMMLLYTNKPPVRNDYAEMRVIFGNDIQVAVKDKANNYCFMTFLTSHHCAFVFNTYKTSKVYGTKIHYTSDPLIERVLKEHIRIRFNGDYNTDKNLLFGVSKETFGKRLQDLFELYTGKRVGIDLLRRSYITRFIEDENPSIARKKEIAEQMLHSYQVQEVYRICKEEEDDD